MGRKNNRIVKAQDKNFEKFIKNFMEENKERVINNRKETSYLPPQKSFKPQLKEVQIDYEKRNRERLEYVKKQLDHLNIQYHVLNEEKTFIECNKKDTNNWIKFYASSGTILGYRDLRGVKALISLLI